MLWNSYMVLSVMIGVSWVFLVICLCALQSNVHLRGSTKQIFLRRRGENKA